MQDIFAQLSQESGTAFTPLGAKAQCVVETPDFRRIRDLPRRRWQEWPHLEELTREMTRYCAAPGGTMALKPVQAVALGELMTRRGLFAPIRVGGGKTLISLLAGLVTGAARAVLLVPASLLEKTRREAYQLARHWRIRPVHLHSYEKLSRDYDDHILGRIRPDLVIADEAHRLKNTRAGCTRRVRAYLQKDPETKTFVALTGTITNRSLRDYNHLLKWSLKMSAPTPLEFDEFRIWCQALDERVDREARVQPGALVRLAPDLADVRCLRAGCRAEYSRDLAACPACGDPTDDIVVGRSAYRDRLISTPGLVSTREDRPPMSLEITGRELEAPEPVCDAILHMRNTWTTPDDHPFEMPTQLWAHCREAQCGFYYVWDPRPPEDWLELRKEWSKFVRETLSNSRTYHTPGHLIKGILSGKVQDDGLYQEWLEIKPTFRPRNVPQWIDDTTLRWAADWLSRSADRLCWVEHRAFGFRLSEMTGIPFFHAKACDSEDNLVDNHTGPAIVSIASCKTGRNLQLKWSKNLYVSPSGNPDDHEQSLGRTHRDGQPQDTVTAEYLFMALESYTGFLNAVRRAEYVEQTTSQPQKLLYGTLDMNTIEILIKARKDPMWIETQGI